MAPAAESAHSVAIRPIAPPTSAAPPAPFTQSHTARIIPVTEQMQHEIQTAAKPLSQSKISEQLLAEAGITPTDGAASLAAPPNNTFNIKVVEDSPNLPSLPMSHASNNASGRMKFMLIWLGVLLILFSFGLYLAIDAGVIKSSVHLPFHIFNGQSDS
jgi:hypothetical protein